MRKLKTGMVCALQTTLFHLSRWISRLTEVEGVEALNLWGLKWINRKLFLEQVMMMMIMEQGRSLDSPKINWFFLKKASKNTILATQLGHMQEMLQPQKVFTNISFNHLRWRDAIVQ